MISRITFTFFLLIALSMGLYWYNFQYSQISLPFNCLYSTDYTFNYKGEHQTLHIEQELNAGSLAHAYFLMNGTAEASGNTYKVNRTILLDNGEVEHGGYTILRYTVNSVKKKGDDNLPDDIFDTLMNEYTLSSDMFELYVYPQGRGTYLLGGTFSYLSMCLRY